MKTLIAITSCAMDVASGVNKAIRETWAARLKSFGIDYRFFIGVGEEKTYDPLFLIDYKSHKLDRPQDAHTIPLNESLLIGDEVLVDCPDSWLYLALKVQESRKWAIAKDYDYIFKIDVDCILNPEKLIASDYKAHDYWGCRGDSTGPLIYAGGWMGYSLSKKAAMLTTQVPVTRIAEDCWTGEVMKRNCIPLQNWSKSVITQIQTGHGNYTAQAIRLAAKSPLIRTNPAAPVRIVKNRKLTYMQVGKRHRR